MSIYYTESHESITVDGNIATLNLTDYAIEQLGDLVYIEMPELDAEFEKGDSIVVVESVKAASDTYAPVSGKIVEVNEAAVDEPSVVNELDPQTGWLVRIEMSDVSELEALMDTQAYEAFSD